VAHRAYNACDWARFRGCFEPDGLIVDHRPVSWGTIDVRVDGVLENLQNPFVTDARMWTRSVHAASAEVVLASVMLAGHDAEGAPIETPQLVLVVMGPNAMARNEVFPPEALDAAFAAYERLVSLSAEPANRATEAFARSGTLYADHDWDALRALYRDDMVFDDRRPVIGTRSDASASEVHGRAMAEQGIERFATRVVATRGDRLALVAWRGESLGDDAELFAAESLAVVEVDDDDRIAAYVGFAVDDPDAAVAELDRRHLDGEGVAYGEMLSLTFRAMAAYNAADWHALTACYAADVEFVDQHFGGWGTRSGRAAALEYFETTSTALGRGHALVRSIDACANDTILVTMLVTSNDADAPAEILLQQVFHRTGREIDRAVGFYTADRVDAARAEYERLVSGAHARPANACTALMRRWQECFAARDWDGLGELLTEDHANDDRRVLGGGLQMGRDVSRATVEAFAALGVSAFVVDFVAVRGERLALMAVTDGGTDDSVVHGGEALAVCELAPDGRLAAFVTFDDLDAAVAELEQRYLAGEGAPYADLWQAVAHNVAAVNAHDWDAMRRGLAPRFVSIRHEHGGWDDQASAAEYVASLQEMMTVFSGAHVVIEHIRAISAEAVACAVAVRSTGAGASIELAFQVVFQGSNGRLERGLTFGASESDRALAAYEQLRAEPGDRLSNRCTEVYARFRALFATRDWEAMRAVVADDFVMDDRLPVIGSVQGGRKSARNMRLLAEQGARQIEARTLAIRGERLSLIEARIPYGPPGAEVVTAEGLCVIALGADGRLASFTQFAPDELDGAFTELERRHIAGEGAPCSVMLELVWRGVDAWNRGDWDAFAACYAPSVEHRDGFPAEWRVRTGRDAIVQEVVAGKAIFPTGYGYNRSILACSQHAALCEYVMSVRNSDGTTTDLVHNMLYRRAGALIDHIDIYGADSVDAALAAFTEAARRPPELSNRCVEAHHRWIAAMNRGDEHGMAALFAPGFVVEEHRRGMIATGVGPVDDTRLAQELGLQMGSFEAIAVRGDRVALARWTFVGSIDGGGEFESAMLSLNEVDAEGRIVWGATYDVDDLAAAIADLEWKYIEGEGAPYARILRLVVESNRGRDARDWDAYRSCFDPDVVTVDHYSAGWGTRHGIDELIALSHHTVATIDDSSMVMTEIESLTTESLLCSLVLRGRGAPGDRAELAFTVRFHLGPRGLDRVEAFAFGRAEEPPPRAEARLDATRLENRATAAEHRIGELIEARDLGAIAAWFAPGYEQADHRRGNALGGDPVDSIRIAIELGVEAGRYEPLAIRGERLALGRHRYRGSTADGGSFENEFLQVQEVDERGRAVRTAVLEVDDLETAVDILDEWYVVGDGAPFADVWRLVNSTAAYNARDWDEFRSTFAPGAVIIDHRPAGWGTLADVDAQVVALRALIELVPDARTLATAIRHISRSAVVFSARAFGHDLAGGPVELVFHLAVHVGPNGIEREEMFPPDGLDAALASVAPRTDALRNGCTQTGDRLCELFAARDWPAFATIFAPDFDGDDFRRGFTSFDADPVKSFGLVAELGGAGTRLELRPVATRGDCLALSECWLFNEYDTQPGIFLTEVAPDGRLTWMAAYDGNDLERAFHDLDERYAAGEAAPFAENVRIAGALVTAYNARDWDAFTGLMVDDFVAIDRRPASFGTRVGPWNFVEALLPLIELLPTYTLRRSWLQAVAHGVAFMNSGSAVQSDGAEYRVDFFIVAEIRDGRVTRYDIYAIDAIDAVMTRLAELAGDASVAAPPALENECTRLLHRFHAALLAGDLVAFRALLDDDVVLHDLRPIVRHDLVGADSYMESVREALRIGAVQVTSTPLATRGDRGALHHVVQGEPSGRGMSLSYLAIDEAGADGRLRLEMFLAEDDLDRADTELDRVYLAGEGAECESIVRTTFALIDAYNTRDWSRYRALYSDDAEIVDHRPVSLGAIPGVDTWVEWAKALLGVNPTFRVRIRAMRADAGAVIIELDGRSDDGDGGVVTDELVVVLCIVNERVTRYELFTVEARDTATRHFATLAGTRVTPAGAVDNECLRLNRHANALLGRHDFAAIAALCADDVVYDDRRRGLGGRSDGRDAYIEMLGIVDTFDDFTVEFVPMATRGDRGAMWRVIYEGIDPQPDFIALLVVGTVDASSRIASLVAFDPDDLDAGYAVLEEQYLAGEGVAQSDVWKLVVAWRDAFNARAWDAMGELNHRDLAFVDHNLVGYGSGRRAHLRELGEAFVAATPDVYLEFHEIVAISAVGALARTSSHATNAGGGQFGAMAWQVLGVRAGKISSIDIFPPPELEAARTRFAELRRPKSGPMPNRALDATRRATDALARGDQAAFDAVHVPGFVNDDRRSAMQLATTGSQAIVDDIMRTAVGYDLKELATRGENLALHRGTYRGRRRDGFEWEIPVLGIIRVGDDGRIVRGTIFDADDCDAAYAELDAQYVEELTRDDRAGGAVWATVARWNDGFNRRDGALADTAAAPDMAYEDHRTASYGTLDRDGVMALAHAIVGVTPDARIRFVEIAELRANGVVARAVIESDDNVAGGFDSTTWWLLIVRDDLIRRLETFDVEDRAAAVARLAELSH
jgi:hypothetical protein